MDIYQEAVQYLEAEHVAVPEESDVSEDVFPEVPVPSLFSPTHTECSELPDTPTLCGPEVKLERRLVVLRGILESEEVYLKELEALLTPMKALWASAGTSQPVLSSQQVHTIFYQIPELRELHRQFFMSLRDRLGGEGPEPGEGRQAGCEVLVGDLFLKMMNQIGVYGGFIANYEEAVEIVRKCTNPRFRTLAESMMANSGSDKTKYTFEALLYKPLGRVTKTTLVLRDLLTTTPEEHSDHAALTEALRLSRGFLAGINESSHSKREVTLSRVRRQLMRDGFVVDACEGERRLRHLFLYTDLLLCTKVKPAAKRKLDQYRFCWYLPLAGLRLRWSTEHERPADTHLQLRSIRAKLHLLQQQLWQQMRGSRGLVDRTRKKLEQMELMLLTHSPVHRLELHSPTEKSRSLFLSSLSELDEWREAVHRLVAHDVDTVPPDLLTLTSACVKLRMTQSPQLYATGSGEDDKESLRGTLTVSVHSACRLRQPECVYVCVEVDGLDLYDRHAQTHTSVPSLTPCWHQELSLHVDGARTLRVLCVSQAEGQDDTVLGKTSLKLDSQRLHQRWTRHTLSFGSVEVSLSLKYCPHPLELPRSSTNQQQPVFCVPIGTVAEQEGVLVPHVVRCCVEEVERRGLDEVGIYRISGAASDLGSLKAAFNCNLRDAVSRLRRAEVNVVSSLLKLYFRELPEPLIPSQLFQSLAKALDIQDMDTRLVSMLALLQSCPHPNRQTFLFLLHHLKRVSERQNVNKMSVVNLATVFGPSLLRPPVAKVGYNGPTVDISQEVVVQVQVLFFYMQCNSLPEPQISVLQDADVEDETTHL